MSVLTEQMIREKFADADLSTITEYAVPPGTVVTPSARAWLIDQRIQLVDGQGGSPRPRVGSKAQKAAANAVSALPEFSKPDHYELLDGST
ncbi:MAG: hypothetical protein LBK28_00605, partial [Propionibacteriaceae bacterium]|nr:hypothetical protein [Propionibacteriaceae bacterium]